MARETLPEVAVTVMVEVPGGVPPGGGCGGAIVSKAHRWLDNAAAAG